MSTAINPAVRALDASEIAGVSGGAINADFSIFGIRLMFRGGDYWQSVCVADDESYGCVTSVGGKLYTSSGPVPK